MPLSYRYVGSNVNPVKSKVYVDPENQPPVIPAPSGCQVIIFPGYTEFSHPVSKRGNWIENKNKRNRKRGQQDLNAFVYKKELESTRRAILEKRGNRKAITQFSASSRKHLLKKLHSLSELPSILITLTYPKFYPADSREWKRHLDNFRRVLLEHYPKAWFFWKLEPQRRGAPHYHLLGNTESNLNIHLLRKHVAAIWYQVCGTGDEKHLLAGTGIEVLKKKKGSINAYVSKYMSKIDLADYEEWAHPGRFWGILGKKNLPEVISFIFDLDKPEYYVMRRLIRRWLNKQSQKCRKYSDRLRKVPSFFVILPCSIVYQFLDLIQGKVPF
jgi:hypothetical protein